MRALPSHLRALAISEACEWHCKVIASAADGKDWDSAPHQEDN